MRRYHDELRWLMEGTFLKGNVLVVTHGEVRLRAEMANLRDTEHAGTSGGQPSVRMQDSIYWIDNTLLTLLPETPKLQWVIPPPDDLVAWHAGCEERGQPRAS